MSGTSIPIEVRSETPEDQTAIWHVNREAFDSRDEADLVDNLRDGGHLFASVVAEDEREVNGHAALSIGFIGEARVLILAPVAVKPESQGEGIGAALIHELIALAGDTPICVLGDPGYYARFGFEAAEPFGVSAPFGVEPGALQLLHPEQVPAGMIEYPAPFLQL